MSIKRAHATAHSNIALVKYWGKRPSSVPDLNLPAVSSLSMTLDELRTETTIDAAPVDTFELNGEAQSPDVAKKVFAHLDRVWNYDRRSDPRPPASVRSINHLPTAAGLASSASGFAALTLAAASAFGVDASRSALSTLARRGSGSAARSLWGGFVELQRGEADDGHDCLARPIFPQSHWDVRLLIVHTTRGQKTEGSTGGMERCRQTSPYYPAWVSSSDTDIAEAKIALEARDLTALGTVMEHSCFKMHASMMASQPALLYWNGASLDVIRRVWQARAAGLSAYATSDAGPHIKVLCAAGDAEALAAQLRDVAGVQEVQSVGVGPDAAVEVQA